MAMRMAIERRWVRRSSLAMGRPGAIRRRSAPRRMVVGLRVLPMSLIWRRRMPAPAASPATRTAPAARALPAAIAAVPVARMPVTPVTQRLPTLAATAFRMTPKSDVPTARGTSSTLVERQVRTVHTTDTVRWWSRLPAPMAMRRSSPIAAARPERLRLLHERIITMLPAPLAASAPPPVSAPGNVAARPAAKSVSVKLSHRRGRVPDPAPGRATTRSAQERRPLTTGLASPAQSRNHRLAERHFHTVAAELRRERGEHVHAIRSATRFEEVSLRFRTKLAPAMSHASSGDIRGAAHASPEPRPATREVRSVVEPEVGQSLRRPSPVKPAAAVDAALTSRLADEVMRKIEQRLRIERERFGL